METRLKNIGFTFFLKGFVELLYYFLEWINISKLCAKKDCSIDKASIGPTVLGLF